MNINNNIIITTIIVIIKMITILITIISNINRVQITSIIDLNPIRRKNNRMGNLYHTPGHFYTVIQVRQQYVVRLIKSLSP